MIVVVFLSKGHIDDEVRKPIGSVVCEIENLPWKKVPYGTVQETMSMPTAMYRRFEEYVKSMHEAGWRIQINRRSRALLLILIQWMFEKGYVTYPAGRR